MGRQCGEDHFAQQLRENARRDAERRVESDRQDQIRRDSEARQRQDYEAQTRAAEAARQDQARREDEGRRAQEREAQSRAVEAARQDQLRRDDENRRQLDRDAQNRAAEAARQDQSRRDEEERRRLYVTYTKQHEISREIYTGRTSGYGDPQSIVDNRERNHHTNEHGLMGRAVLDKSSHDYAAIRGREEQLIQRHGGPQAFGGTSGNYYSGISDSNKKRDYYIKKSEGIFGKMKTLFSGSDD